MRRPAVAGQFYEGTRETLLKQIEGCYTHPQGPGKVPKTKQGPRKLLGLVSPHAGYMYSGPVAAHGFAHLAQDGKPSSFVILGPNHSGAGSGVSIITSGSWKTPLGEVKVDEKLSKAIWNVSDIIDADEQAHLYEHSIEVQLPFIQQLYGSDFTFVPICMMLQDERTSIEVGNAISEASADRDIVIVASTDFTHYESQSSAEKKDKKAIEKIVALDVSGLVQTVEQERISMCGYGPVAAMLQATKNLGAKEAQLLKHATSGDTAGPMSQVVGYGSVTVSR